MTLKYLNSCCFIGQSSVCLCALYLASHLRNGNVINTSSQTLHLHLTILTLSLNVLPVSLIFLSTTQPNPVLHSHKTPNLYLALKTKRIRSPERKALFKNPALFIILRRRKKTRMENLFSSLFATIASLLQNLLSGGSVCMGRWMDAAGEIFVISMI